MIKYNKSVAFLTLKVIQQYLSGDAVKRHKNY
jgi:hypothetical protein